MKILKQNLVEKTQLKKDVLELKEKISLTKLALDQTVESMTIMELLEPENTKLMKSRINQIHQDLLPFHAWDPDHCCPGWEINQTRDSVKATCSGGVLSSKKLDRTKENVWRIRILTKPDLICFGVAFQSTHLDGWSKFDNRGWGWGYQGSFYCHNWACTRSSALRPFEPGTVVEMKLTTNGELHFRHDGVNIGCYPTVIPEGDVYPAVMIHTSGEIEFLADI